MTVERENETELKHHCVHVIGMGRTGAAYVEALLRTGEIEDALALPGTSFAALLIDIGQDDLFVANDYARSLKGRLTSRGLPEEKFHYESIALEVPDTAAFNKDLNEARVPFNAAIGHDLIAELPKEYQMPKSGQHVPRAIAKALAAIKTQLGDKPIDVALTRFADQVNKAGGPSTVLVAFGLAGGTGSGMAADLARTLRGKLPPNTQVVGVGQLSHSGDGEYYNNLAQTMAIEEIDRAQCEKGERPFPGGFFVVASEHSWQRLTAYTGTGVKEVRQRFKQMVTNRFVADSFMRWVVADNSSHLLRALQHEAGKYVLFDVAKLTHPGVQVLPGESASNWEAVLQQWISFTPKFSGLTGDFNTDYAEVHVHASRDMQIATIDAGLKDIVASTYLNGSGGAVRTFRNEFFDALTSYGNVILPGATKDSLSGYAEVKSAMSKMDAMAKTLETA